MTTPPEYRKIQLLESALALPASGPIGVEGDRGQMEYRRIRMRVPGSD